jgi:7,8-dihydropterin-6-yl-methyl-4-(beta-D-ribofuranosyl)aminobenzene 5'-phosphate synthase
MVEGSLPEGVVQLDELEILVVVDNETDTLSSVDEGVPQIPEIVQVAARTSPTRRHEGHECKAVFDQLCCACHGLSLLITGRRHGHEHVMLFDVGPYPDLWLDNAQRLAVNLSRIECLFLSHWHSITAAVSLRSFQPSLMRGPPPDSRCRLLTFIPIDRTNVAS